MTAAEMPATVWLVGDIGATHARFGLVSPDGQVLHSRTLADEDYPTIDDAIAAFLAEPPFLGRRPVFVGDDATDEDGFAEIERRSGIAIRVGPIAASTARYRLPSVAAVLAWLAGRPESY